MLKGILSVLFVFFLAVGTVIALEQLWREGVLVKVENPLTQTAAVAQAGAFSATGTLAYDENNAGVVVPYLVYRTAQGEVRTKALKFSGSSSCGALDGEYPCPLIADSLRTYFGTNPVHVTGKIVAEHVLVEKLSTASL